VTLALDHLVVAAPSIEVGVSWCEDTLGIAPGPGGAHPLMGTHNRLFRIASERFANAYFEISAIDPAATPPARTRWFGLDALDLSSGPRLIHWVARTVSLDRQLAALRDAGIDAGRAIEASRDTPQGPLRWRIAVRDDGAMLRSGALPTLIEWGSAQHPAASMPDSGVRLRSLTLRGLDPGAAAVLVLDGVELAADAGPAITAQLDTPRGPVTLSSRG
jgi:hypothetical protein